MQSEGGDPPAEVTRDEAESEPPDRDERRVRALERMFRRAVEGERRLSTAAMKKIGAALRGEPTTDDPTED